MLNQVIGRVGRGHRAAQVIVQTYNPGSPIIKQALTKNYADFYTNQLTERRQFHFPPYCHLLKLSVARLSQATAQQAATTLATSLKQRALPVEVVGPSPAFVAKAGGLYHWQLVIKAPGRSSLLSIIASLPANWSYDIDPLHLL
ncbi:hypothetical protein HY218_00720 [Candidatus Saccharibacteria bacterium]|nr:hypothetical protein [Candidatus Saccharibacteria bacterium]